MKYRIREVTLQNGTKTYHCERTGFFKKNTWRLMKFMLSNFVERNAIFDTLKEAETFLGLRSPVVESKIVYQSE